MAGLIEGTAIEGTAYDPFGKPWGPVRVTGQGL